MTPLHPATVVTQGGRVVGVQFAAAVTRVATGPRATLRAGPGQVAHQLELEMPAKGTTHDAIERFHAEIERRLRAAS